MNPLLDLEANGYEELESVHCECASQDFLFWVISSYEETLSCEDWGYAELGRHCQMMGSVYGAFCHVPSHDLDHSLDLRCGSYSDSDGHALSAYTYHAHSDQSFCSYFSCILDLYDSHRGVFYEGFCFLSFL